MLSELMMNDISDSRLDAQEYGMQENLSIFCARCARIKINADWTGKT